MTDRLDRSSSHETGDAYVAVVARLNDLWRVIRCRDGIQWILQRRDGQRAGGTRWTGSCYLTTREALIRVCRTRAGDCDPIAWWTLLALPERYEPADIPTDNRQPEEVFE